MTRWEYWATTYQIAERWGAKRQAAEIAAFQGQLNEAGQNGWELLSFDALPVTGAFSGNIKGYLYLALYKRPQTEPIGL
jgi:hypothetical protein